MMSAKQVTNSLSGLSRSSNVSHTPMRMVSCVILRLYFFEICKVSTRRNKTAAIKHNESLRSGICLLQSTRCSTYGILHLSFAKLQKSDTEAQKRTHLVHTCSAMSTARPTILQTVSRPSISNSRNEHQNPGTKNASQFLSNEEESHSKCERCT